MTIQLVTPQNQQSLRNRIVDTKSFNDMNSPLMFKAYERELFYTGSDEDYRYRNTGHKALVRVIEDRPVCLNVVKDTYKVIQNEELFDTIHSGMHHVISDMEFASATIKDKIAFNGTQCFREYVFPDIGISSPEKDRIAFRVIIQNGFGTGAIKLYAGAIDFFCTNGLIIGAHTSAYAKHTRGVTLTKFEDTVRYAVDRFWKRKNFYNDLARRKITDSKAVHKFLCEHFGDRNGSRLYHQYEIECKARKGNTLWALFSALTYYSSHATGDFSLRNTGNDHEAVTMMRRETNVAQITASDMFMRLAA